MIPCNFSNSVVDHQQLVSSKLMTCNLKVFTGIGKSKIDSSRVKLTY